MCDRACRVAFRFGASTHDSLYVCALSGVLLSTGSAAVVAGVVEVVWIALRRALLGRSLVPWPWTKVQGRF